MTQHITVRRIRGGSLVKLILFGSMIGGAAVMTVFGFFGLFGAEIIMWNDHYVTGVKGFLASPFMGLFGGGIMGLMSSFFIYIGLRIYSFFRPLEIEYIPSD